MKQLLVRNLEDRLVAELKERAASNGISAEEQHRRILIKVLSEPETVKEPIGTYLVKHPVCPELDLPIERSREPEERDIGF